MGHENATCVEDFEAGVDRSHYGVRPVPLDQRPQGAQGLVGRFDRPDE
jgi:hypothetical protein